MAIKFDTFPFTRYGLAYGTLRIVSANSFTGQDQRANESSLVPVTPNDPEPYFRARIAIDLVALRGLPSDFQLTPGMPVAADIKVGKQTILQYLLQRVLPVVSQSMREP